MKWLISFLVALMYGAVYISGVDMNVDVRCATGVIPCVLYYGAYALVTIALWIVVTTKENHEDNQS